MIYGYLLPELCKSKRQVCVGLNCRLVSPHRSPAKGSPPLLWLLQLCHGAEWTFPGPEASATPYRQPLAPWPKVWNVGETIHCYQSCIQSQSCSFFLSLIFVLLQNAGGGECRWVGQTERRYWGISAGAQERAGQTGWRTSSTVLQVSSVLISPNWSMKQTYLICLLLYCGSTLVIAIFSFSF